MANPKGRWHLGLSGLMALAALGLGGCEGPMGSPLPPNMPDAPCKCDPGNTSGSCKVSYQRAQICPDLSPVQFCSRFVGKTAEVDLLLYNRGLEGLRITQVDLVGDDNCAFERPVLSFTPGSTIIGHQRSEALHLSYTPRKAGPDYAMLRIQSSAENFPVLNIAVCGQGYTGPLANPDGGCLPCMKPAGDKPACGTRPDGGT